MEFFDSIYDFTPRLKNSLRGGASAEDIAKLESCFGTIIPEAYIDFLKCHNGEAEEIGLFLGFVVFGVDQIIHEHQLSKKMYRKSIASISSFPQNKIKEDCYNPLWLPMATDGGGNFIALDLNPAQDGDYGQVISYGRDEQTMYVLATNFEDWLEFVTQNLRSNCEVLEDDGTQYISWRGGHFFDDLDRIFPAIDHSVKGDLIDWNLFDEEWKSLIQKLLGKEAVYISDFDQIKELRLLQSNISKLLPVKFFRNSTKLVASGLTITDFDSLTYAPWLKILYLAKTNLNDISCLEKFSKLGILSIGNTSVNDISVLPKLKSLSDLSLENLNIADYSPLFKCTKLKQLNLSGTNFSEFDSLSQLKNLSELSLNNIRITSVDFLSKLHKLEKIELNNCDANDFESLSQLNKLHSIQCPFDIFLKTKCIFDRKIQYAMIGGVTPEQKAIWKDYIFN